MGDTIEKEGLWTDSTGSVRLLYFKDFLYRYESVYQKRYKYKQGLKSESSDKYILIRKKAGDDFRYGWIKISVTGKYPHREGIMDRLRVLESVMEE